jgi:hypothetical protein
MKKYIMHVAGPDDLYEFDEELEALRRANEINKLYLKETLEYGKDAVLLVATVHDRDEVNTPDND